MAPLAIPAEHCRPRTEGGRQVAPSSTRPGDPENPLESPALIAGQAAGPRLPWWEERRQVLPAGLRQFSGSRQDDDWGI
jgi:hypothetical protein